jgi:hypothetical protein
VADSPASTGTPLLLPRLTTLSVGVVLRHALRRRAIGRPRTPSIEPIGEIMAKQRNPAAVPPKNAYKPRGTAFKPTQAQRAFVAAAAGLGVPCRAICQMMPGGRGGHTPLIDSMTLRCYFRRELQDGLKLATALVEARVYQRALSEDDRSALSAQALILNTRGGWKSAENLSLQQLDDPPLAMHRLTREERDTMKRLLAKATEPASAEDSKPSGPSAEGDSRPRKRKRRHGRL